MYPDGLDRKPMVFQPDVLVASPEHEFRWLGRVACGGVFDGEHYFLIKPTTLPNGVSGTAVEHGEHFSGCLICCMSCCIHAALVDKVRSRARAMHIRCGGEK
jgi:hypothetical protein